jgi:hypothetical protein
LIPFGEKLVAAAVSLLVGNIKTCVCKLAACVTVLRFEEIGVYKWLCESVKLGVPIGDFQLPIEPHEVCVSFRPWL